jgi:hypothetical protein
METTPPARALRPMRGLLLLALANVFIWLAWRCFTTALYSTSLGLPYAMSAFQSAIGQSQAASYGIVAALVPRRRFVGLVWATGIALLLGTIRAAESTIISLSRAGKWSGSSELMIQAAYIADQTVTMFVLVQALRFVCGWRIAVTDESILGQRGQFRIGDLLEWTVSVGVWLAINRFIKMPVDGLYHFSLTILGTDIILLPIALAATSKRGLRLPVVAALFAWTLAVELLWYGLVYIHDPADFSRGPWWIYVSRFAGDIAGWLLATGFNFAIIRRLGFRWRSVPISSG